MTSVSIIIPLYNKELYIEETILSIKAQTWQNYELIIVDDGSTDSSYTIAKKFECHNIKVFRQRNKGASAARNYGLRLASGQFIQFIDGDDLLAANKLEKQIAKIGNCTQDVVTYCSTIHFNNGTNPLLSLPNPYEESFLNYSEIPSDFMINLWGGKTGNGSMIAMHAWLIPKKLIENTGYWNEELTLDDDGDFFGRIVLNSSKIVFTEETFCYYRKFADKHSLSQSNDEKAYISALKSIISKKENLFSISKTFEAQCAIYKIFTDLAQKTYLRYPYIYKQIKTELPKINYPFSLDYGGHVFTRKISNIIGWKPIVFLQRIKVYLIKNGDV